jgi:hypothetical protein
MFGRIGRVIARITGQVPAGILAGIAIIVLESGKRW